MAVRVALLAAGSTAVGRDPQFDRGAPLGETARASVRAAASRVPRTPTTLTAPSPRCRDTAAELGRTALVEGAIDDWDMGRWRGRALAEVAAGEPDAVAAWLGDPAAVPHGGESLLALCERVGGWLDRLADPAPAGRVLAIVEPAVVRAAVVHALHLPPPAFWRLDVRPLALTELSGRAGRWNLRLGA
ncbi:histidine phosphatase family protein [Streptomyces sp. NPDC047315]|uniref:histidine phosphatase family protein n=1 Tax=Streptomyces sp. NPDC047315 TaxID=3155142 RepID=UPI0033DCE0D4